MTNQAINKQFAYYLIILILLFTNGSCSSVNYFHRELKDSTRLKTNDEEVSLITYNIKAIYEKEDDQIENLMSFVNKNKFDFVVFQELFDESTRDKIIEDADPEFYKTFI